MSSEFNSRLANFLSASETRSGEAIAAELGCSRTAVWKHVKALRAHGIEVDAVAGQGYRLLEPLELLDKSRIRSRIESPAASYLDRIVLLDVVDSTNKWLQSKPLDEQAGTAVLAECQTAGRGRRGQPWISPFGRNIYLSLGWKFDTGVGELGCLPLLLALSASDALAEAGLEGHSIKWPNDLQLPQGKLGGCLVEVQGDVHGPCFAVLGIGINVRMPASAAGTGMIDQPWTDIAGQIPAISRNRLAGGLLNILMTNLERYEREGFEPFMPGWRMHDGLEGKEIEFTTAGGSVRGISRGISARGGLLLQTGEAVAEYLSGEASLIRKGIQD